jgi:hypothetical protein
MAPRPPIRHGLLITERGPSPDAADRRSAVRLAIAINRVPVRIAHPAGPHPAERMQPAGRQTGRRDRIPLSFAVTLRRLSGMEGGTGASGSALGFLAGQPEEDACGVAGVRLREERREVDANVREALIIAGEESTSIGCLTHVEGLRREPRLAAPAGG